LTPNEEQFLKEYSRIMKHNADALNVLQREKKIGLGFLLPAISELKGRFQKLQDDPTIIHCQPLITGLLDAIHFRYVIM
jgi:putative NADH-flavin reductase